jgi:hypothetical protein
MNQLNPFEEVVSMKTPVHAVKSTNMILMVQATGKPAYLPGNSEVPAVVNLMKQLNLHTTHADTGPAANKAQPLKTFNSRNRGNNNHIFI